MALPRVLVVTTGGTIAGARRASGTVEPALGPADLLARIPAAAYARCDVDPWLAIPSNAMRFTDMLGLARRVKAALSDPDLAGVVITHGTATLEQTAYFVDVTLGEDRPIVFTGAMRNPTLPSEDGALNLLNAIQVAACDRSRGLGVLVVMNGAIHCARDVTKTHSANAAAFQSPEFGPLGAVDEDYVFYARRPFSRIRAVMPPALTARVERIPSAADSSDMLLRAAVDGEADGVVVESGRLSAAQVALLTRAMGRGTTVVVANPYGAGRLHRDTYRHEGAEAHLLSLGMIFTGTSGLKARVKLTALLSAGLPREEIRALFHAEWQ
ncbi:MAG TPA: asparaginase [bacterium]|nr:asparaginase [bacterium]